MQRWLFSDRPYVSMIELQASGLQINPFNNLEKEKWGGGDYFRRHPLESIYFKDHAMKSRSGVS